MPRIDWPLEQCRSYKPELWRQPDFEAFWNETLDEARREPLNEEVTEVDYPIRQIRVRKVSFTGLQNRVVGWLITPATVDAPLPAVIFYHGYSGSKDAPYTYTHWVIQGYAVLAIDVRGQSGESTDNYGVAGGRMGRGWMTAGILDPKQYFYRGAYADAVRAIDFMDACDEVDSTFIALTGVSQGGGLTIAAAALDNRPAAAMPEVPFLCDYRRSVDATPNGPYPEIADYFRKYPEHEGQGWKTLSYFDCMNLAPMVTCPTLMSVGLWDDICMPSTCLAAFNHISGEKEAVVYPYLRHEHPTYHVERQMAWLNALRTAKGK